MATASALTPLTMYDICVVGLGALGILYADCLDRSGQARITAVCRSNLEILRDHGVNVESDKLGTHRWKPFRAVSSAAEAADRQYRFTVCTFKALPDVISTPDILGPLLEKTDTFVLIQNGVGIESALQKRVPDSIIISACAWVDATVVDDGNRLTQCGKELLTLGVHRPPLDLSSDFAEVAAQGSLDLICQLFKAGGGSAESGPDIVARRWAKILWNASYSTICTLTRGNMADVLAEPHIDRVNTTVESIMDEIISVARKADINLALLEEAKRLILAKTKGSPFKPSMLVDLNRGRPIEVEVIVGEVVRKAAEVGVSVPRLEMIYALLRIIQCKLMES